MWALVFIGWGCGGSAEGANPGECSDVSDNDADGLIDCFDPDCATSTECGGDDTDPSTEEEGLTIESCLDDVDNDDDGAKDCGDEGCEGLFECDVCADRATDSGASAVPTLTGFDVTFVRTYDFNEFGDSLCGLSQGVCDCVATYVGSATFAEAAGSTATFTASWALDAEGTTCQDFEAPGGTDNLARQVWYDDLDPSVFMTLRFSRDGTRLDQWVVHNFAEKDFPVSEDEGIRENAQFWMACMDVPFATVLPYAESVNIPLSDGVELRVTDSVEFGFR